MIKFDYGLLRILRKRRGLKQAEVASKLGVSGATISHWELGDSPISAQDLARLLALYGENSADQFFVFDIESKTQEDYHDCKNQIQKEQKSQYP